MDLVFLSLQGLRISRYPGEDAFLSSHEVGDCTQHRFSSCKGFLLPPHPQVGTPVSRKRFALSHATSLFALSRPTFYAAQAAWEDSGIVGLVPQPTGPRHGHKLTEDIIARLLPLAKTMSPAELAVWLQEQQHLTVHPRSIERALARAAKKGGPS